MFRNKFIFIAVMAAVMLISAGAASAACTFTNSKNTMLLNGSCTTTTSIVVPDGKTLDGRGFTITGLDPVAGHFKGGVIINGGGSASVTNVKVTVSGLADVCDAGADRLRGILLDGASGSITRNTVTNINQGPSGCQEGNAIEVRNFGSNPATSRATVDGNTLTGYQKTGVVANGNVDVSVTNNFVDGLGPVGYNARNGIQFGFGGTGSARGNTVNGNSYTGASDVSGGILGAGGPGYGGDFCVNIQIDKNDLDGNDVGVYLSQYEADFTPPSTMTNIKVVNNTITNNALSNGYIYQAGVSDVGNNDKIINNTISGIGYDPTYLPGSTFAVDADSSFTNRAKVHANK